MIGRSAPLAEGGDGMPQGQLYFREMQTEDIPAVAAIERAVFSRPWTERSFQESMQEDTLFIAALKDGAVIGYCGMYCSFGEGEITNVAVTPMEQGRGAGTKMMEYLFGKARERGIAAIFLEVRISNSKAIHLYEQLGFCSCGIRRNFYEMPREDGMVMKIEI